MSKSSKSNRRYGCPYCSYKGTRTDLVTHIEEVHEDMIPENYTAARIVFNKLNNKEQGNCTICGKETKWNEDKWSYDRLCSENCKKKYVEMRDERMKKVHGTTNLLTDPEHQIKMLSNRAISGTYKFKDGGIHGYTGTYELQFLEFMDKVMNFHSRDLMSPGHIIPYNFKGEKLSFITDYYLIPFNLLFDIKPGGKNPNTHQGMEEYNEKQVAKEKQIEKDNQFNYIRLTDNDFSQLIDILMDIKLSLKDQHNRKVIHINEHMIPAGPVKDSIPKQDIRFIAYSNTGNTVDGYAVSTNNLLDTIFVPEGNKLSIKDKSFFKDKYYTMYKTKDICENTIERLYNICKNKEDISFDTCYNVLFESNIISEDQVMYDTRLIREYTSDNTDNSTYDERLNEAVQTCLHYKFIDENRYSFPILSGQNLIDKNLLLEGFGTLDIMENDSGFFVVNKKYDTRSIAFSNILSIPYELLELMRDIRL